MNAASIEPTKTQQPSILEIKDAQVIFSTVWESLVREYGYEQLLFPKELILLGGAPGSGKGTQTNYILNARGLTCPPVVVSSLLQSPEARAKIATGQLVGDKDVVGIVFRELLKPEYRDGALLDGFPRTRVQVECLKMLVDNINLLYNEYSNTSLAINFRRPIIHAMVLFVTEKTSVERQLYRGDEIIAHNTKVKDTGVGVMVEIRETDTEIASATKRYEVFKEQTWDALQSLKEIYHYHFINAEGAIEEVEENVYKELRYQSSLELDPQTYDRLSPLPIAHEITLHARQELVKRLDGYEIKYPDLFSEVVAVIENEFIPVVNRHTFSGRARISTDNELFLKSQALTMLIDVFSERGFQITIEKQIQYIPERFDLSTGRIHNQEKPIFKIEVSFSGSTIRRG
jgi:adenylate kinase